MADLVVSRYHIRRTCTGSLLGIRRLTPNLFYWSRTAERDSPESESVRLTCIVKYT